jgi:glycosyltransferase involved in cell wall biosynthesis
MNSNNSIKKTPPIIYVLTICWNEELFLPYFLNYYSFADKIIVFDNFSSDKSIEIIKKYKNTEYTYYFTNESIRDDYYLFIKNQLWKSYKNDCDWMIIVDIDEIVYHPLDLREFITRLPKDTAYIECYGFEMFSNNFFNAKGDTIFEKCKTGIPHNKHNKISIINTKLVSEINYLAGCHMANPVIKGRIIKDPMLKLLHYKFIVPLPYLVQRYSIMAKRLSEFNKENQYGFHYSNIREMTKKYYSLQKKSKPII